MSDSFQPQILQHANLPCPSLSSRACSDSCTMSQWCHLTISFYVNPFSSCLEAFPISGSFQWVNSSHQMAKILEHQLQHQSFQWKLRVNFLTIDWFDHVAVYETLKSLLEYHNLKTSVFWYSAFFMVQISHPYMTTGKKKIAFTIQTLLTRCLCFFNMLSRFVTAFLPRSKCLFISWLQSLSKVINLSLFPLFPFLFVMKCFLFYLSLSSCRLPWS